MRKAYDFDVKKRLHNMNIIYGYGDELHDRKLSYMQYAVVIDEHHAYTCAAGLSLRSRLLVPLFSAAGISFFLLPLLISLWRRLERVLVLDTDGCGQARPLGWCGVGQCLDLSLSTGKVGRTVDRKSDH